MQGAEPSSVVRGWLERFEKALSIGDAHTFASLFRQHSLWKDLFVLGPQPQVMAVGEPDQVLPAAVLECRLRDIRPAPSRSAPRRLIRSGTPVIEAFFEFRFAGGRGEGIVRLEDAVGLPRATELFTCLQALDAVPERIGELRPGHSDDGIHHFGEPNWADKRRQAAACLDREPEVLIAGAGQAGLALAARLGRLGIDTLVVERNERIGDNWRNRYHSLRLHNAVPVIGLPYFSCPPSWETYLSKDRLASWLEYYADAMDIACWTSTSLESVEREDGAWAVTVHSADGSRRLLKPKHVVLATGVSGAPRMPKLPGLESFEGVVLHSTQFEDGAPFRGRTALVVGAGSSGHDIAQELHSHGASVTMLQRGGTMVASVVPATSQILDRAFTELPQDEADLTAASFPLPSLVRLHQDVTREVKRVDAALHDGLRAAGFRLDFGHDETGVAFKYMRQGGGFYLNVGCSDLIISGEIGLIDSEKFEQFLPDGVRLVDGSTRDFDVVVFATGFEPQQKLMRKLLGDEIVDRVGPIWGLDEVGFPRNVWRPTAQDDLWFMLGNFQQCRFYSRLLALQIAGRLRTSAPIDRKDRLGELPDRRSDAPQPFQTAAR